MKNANSSESNGPLMRKFFISYKHVELDHNLAQTLDKGLKAAGHAVFIDSGIPVGTDWTKEIAKRIDWCDFLVILISKDIRNSEMVQTEIRLAYQRSKLEGSPIILPVRVRYFEKLDYELSAYLDRIQYTKWETDEDSDRILSEFLTVALTLDSRSAIVSGDSLQDIASSALVDNKDYSRPQPAVDPRAFSAPGGSIKLNDPFYLKRNADAIITQRAKNIGETIVITAPRQLGKSSLLLRYLAECNALGKRFALLDFSLFSDVELGNYTTLLQEIAAFLVRTLRINIPDMPQIKNQQQLTNFIEDSVLSVISEPLVVSFDEVDRVLGRSYQGDFFTMLRLWHNKRAEFNSPWERVDLALVISTEPYLLIDSAGGSPFNVTDPIRLAPLEQDDCGKLNDLYGSPLTQSQVEQIYDLLGGHPFLTRLAFYRIIAPGSVGVSYIVQHAAEIDGPFGDHLRAWHLKLCNQPKLLGGIKQIINNGTADEETFYRLYGSGLVRRKGGRICPSNMLYHYFFKNIL